MEMASGLGRSPRETLASVTLLEFRAYLMLSSDRADELEEARSGKDAEDVIDFEEEEMAPGQIAAVFGAKVVGRTA